MGRSQNHSLATVTKVADVVSKHYDAWSAALSIALCVHFCRAAFIRQVEVAVQRQLLPVRQFYDYLVDDPCECDLCRPVGQFS